MIKRFKFLLIFCFLGLFLSGCAPKDKRTVVKFASWGSKSEVEILKPILAEFEKENPDLRVEFIHIPQNYFQKIHLLFASNLAPDVLFINNLYLPIYAHAGVLQNLDELKFETNNDVKVPNRRKFFPEALDALSYGGKQYAIPRDVSNLVMYYNKDIFDKYNVSYPYKGWKLERFLRKAKLLTRDTNNDGKTDIWAVGFEEDLYFYMPYLMSEGGGVLSDDLTHQIITEPKSEKGLQFYTDLRNKYHVAPEKSQSASATMAQLFLQGKLAMHLSGRWLTPKYTQEAKFRWDVINFPAGDAGSVVPMDASGWAMSKKSGHKVEAMRLINYLASRESIQKFTKSGLIVPARIDVAESGLFSNTPQRSSHVFIDVIKTSKKTPVSTDYKEIQDKLNQKTNYLFNSTKTVKEVFKQF